MDKEDIPTADNTVAEIKNYLDVININYSSTANKAELLALIPKNEETIAVDKPESVIEEPTFVPARQAPRYTKVEMLSLITGYMHDYFFIALKKNRTYTYVEALQEVENWKSAGIF